MNEAGNSLVRSLLAWAYFVCAMLLIFISTEFSIYQICSNESFWWEIDEKITD